MLDIDQLEHQGIVINGISLANRYTRLEPSLYCACEYGCENRNCMNPQAPEYNKCWKPENNGGCGCGKKDEDTCQDTSGERVVVRATSRNRVLIPL